MMLTRVKCLFFPAGKTVDTGNTDQQTAKDSFKRLDQDNDGKLNKVSIAWQIYSCRQVSMK